MLLLRGAAGMAWLLAVEPVIKAAASAAIMRLVFIAYLLLWFVGGDLLGGHGWRSRNHNNSQGPDGPVGDVSGYPARLSV
jgi:hypothetical protein